MQTEEFLQKPVWLISLFFLPMHILTQNTSKLSHARVQGFLFFLCQECKHLWEIMVGQIRLAKSLHILALLFENRAKEGFPH